MRKVYLDHSATTPVHPDVLSAMLPYYQGVWGNASSVHAYGREARQAVEESREKVATALGATAREIYFTSGGTESDNMAIRGVANALKSKGKHIITSKIEHHAVLHTCEYLENEGYEITYLNVDKFGMVDPEDLRLAIRPDTVLITIMLANNEVGTIQPIEEIGEIARNAGITLHTDAVQAVGNIPIDVNALKVDLLTLSAHKFYGPKGVGALYVRKGTKFNPITFGGAQEWKTRPGTENVPGIVGLGKAIELAHQNLSVTFEHETALRDRLIEGIRATILDVKLNGHPTKRLPGNVNMSFLYVEGESLILSLDMLGIAVSSGSACTSGSLDPSHVLMSMGMDHQQAHGSLRMTLGRNTSVDDVQYVLDVLPGVVARLRKMSPLYKQH